MKLNKKVIVRTALCAVLVGALGYSFAAKSETKLIPFQGKLTDASGQVIDDGAIVVQFKMYDAPVGGQAKWNGEVQMLSVNGGLVNTTLGTKASLKNVDFSSPTYLEITIDANGDNQIGPEDPPLLPRQSIIPAVYAVKAGDANKLSGYDWSAIFGTNDPTGKIPGNKLADKGITAAQIKDKTITAQQMADSTITSAKLASGAVTSSQLAKNSVTATHVADGEITTAKLAKNAVTTDRIAEKSITTGLMANREMVDASETAAPVGSIVRSKSVNETVGGNTGYAVDAVSPNFQQIPGMLVKLTTSGRPVMVMLHGGYFDVNGYARFQLQRNGTVVGNTSAGSEAGGSFIGIPASSITFIDIPPAGECQYSIHAFKDTSGAHFKFWHNTRLLAFEL